MERLVRVARPLRFLACLVVVMGAASTANATSFGMFGTSPLTLNAAKTVSVGDTFTVDVGFKLDPGDSISSYSMSVEFDIDLGNEVELISIFQPGTVSATGAGISGGPLTTTGTPIGVDSSGSSIGTIMSFAGSTTPGLGIVNAGTSAVDIIIGSITFKALAGVSTDGPDAFLGFFAPGDHLNENSGAPHPHAFTFGDLAVNVVPEPGTFSLVAMGMLGLAARSRKARFEM